LPPVFMTAYISALSVNQPANAPKSHFYKPSNPQKHRHKPRSTERRARDYSMA
jgi:hypothetical protein